MLKPSLKNWLAWCHLALSYLFIYLPIVVLIVFSFNASPSSSEWAGFSLHWYKQFFSSPEMLSAFFTSVIVAFCATALSVTLALLCVFGGKWIDLEFILQIFSLNTILPEIIMAVCVMSFFVFAQIPLGYFSMIAGHSLLGLGIAVPVLRSAFLELDPFITEASLDLGATYLQTFWYVLVPLMGPSILAVSFLIFTISLDDFFVSFFCAGSELQTISTYVFTKVRSVADPSLNAMSAITLMLSFVLVLALAVSQIAEKVFKEEHD